MKYHILAFLFILLMSSCKDNQNVIGQFTLDVPYSIGAGLAPLKTHYFLNPTIGIQFEKYLETKNITAADVLKVEPASAVLTNVSNGQTWGYVRRATVYVFNPDDTREEYLSYELALVPIGTGSDLSMIPYIVDLQRLFYNSKIGIKIGLETRSAASQTVEAILRLKFNVVVE
ncbi:hypothetical protein [Membranihabitans marinus]|uniref:hypothetical protein n=1 Tax=Membranihabitans marinus TaxID=1227546 RepID=UPI001F21C521|nr:hypothetical protein [Membranihabitans marinus]